MRGKRPSDFPRPCQSPPLPAVCDVSGRVSSSPRNAATARDARSAKSDGARAAEEGMVPNRPACRPDPFSPGRPGVDAGSRPVSGPRLALPVEDLPMERPPNAHRGQHPRASPAALRNLVCARSSWAAPGLASCRWPAVGGVLEGLLKDVLRGRPFDHRALPHVQPPIASATRLMAPMKLSRTPLTARVTNVTEDHATDSRSVPC
jgi:hypothetical protein